MHLHVFSAAVPGRMGAELRIVGGIYEVDNVPLLKVLFCVRFCCIANFRIGFPYFAIHEKNTSTLRLLHCIVHRNSDRLNMAEPNETSSADEAKAREILHVVEKYGLNYERTGSWDGFDTFLPIVTGAVSRSEPIKMLLPGFPFKSPNNRTKVLGVLPDLGEELALKRLEGLARAVEEVYEHGAEIHITSDGLVYNSTSP
jgi:hypothetical protein